MSYIIKDTTCNYGHDYIDFDGKNVEQYYQAKEFSTHEDAEEFAKSLNSNSHWYSIEEYHELDLSIKTYKGNATIFLSQKNGETLSWKDVSYSLDDLLAYEGQTEDEVLDEYRQEIQEWIWEVEAELPYQTYLDNDKLDDIMLSLKIQLSPMLP